MNTGHGDAKKELEGILSAIGQLKQNEVAAMDFYHDAGKRAKDPMVEKLLYFLADMEKEHHKMLDETEDRLKNGKTVSAMSFTQNVTPFDLRIDMPDLTGRESLMKTLEEASALEMKSQYGFEHAAEKTNMKELREFFLSMAGEERRHFLLLKDVAWSLGNFGMWANPRA